MNVFEAPDFDRHETVAFCEDRKTGLRCIIAIHSTALGAACGGTRMYPYASTDAALTDALRLSRGMSYKNAIADIPLGGGKAVIIGDPAKDKSRERLLAYAEAINGLAGRYITAMDVGITPADMPTIASGTKFVAGYDQPGKSGGDSGPLTALGVFVGLKSAVKHRLSVDNTKGLTIAIQGLGKVGMGLARRLHAEGASLIVADTNGEAVRFACDTFGAKSAPPDEVAFAECDVYSPNALGAVLNDDSIPRLHACVVAGGANNQLARDEHGSALRARDILYAPDYVINGGGIIRVAGQIFGWSDAEIEKRVMGIGNTLTAIFRCADAEGITTNAVADRMAEQRMTTGEMPELKAHAAE